MTVSRGRAVSNPEAMCLFEQALERTLLLPAKERDATLQEVRGSVLWRAVERGQEGVSPLSTVKAVPAAGAGDAAFGLNKTIAKSHLLCPCATDAPRPLGCAAPPQAPPGTPLSRGACNPGQAGTQNAWNQLRSADALRACE